jgi:hypothetical protein
MRADHALGIGDRHFGVEHGLIALAHVKLLRFQAHEDGDGQRLAACFAGRRLGFRLGLLGDGNLVFE